MSRTDNPFASPLASLVATPEADTPLAEAEKTRKKYLNHEAAIQSIGQLYLLGSALLALAAVGVIFVSLRMREDDPVGLLVGLFYFGLAVLSFWVGYGLRRLNSKVRVAAGITCGFGLILVPIGTIINAYAFYLIFSQKGEVVFSPEYHEVMRLTPHIKYRTSVLSWTVLILFIIAVIVAIVRVSG